MEMAPGLGASRAGVTRRDLLALSALGLVAGAPGGGVRRRAGGPADLGRARLAGADLVRPGRDAGDHHAVHGALRAARRDGEADARQAAGAEPGRIVVRPPKTGSPTTSCCARAPSSTTATR